MKPYYEHAGKYGKIGSCLADNLRMAHQTEDGSKWAIPSSPSRLQNTARESQRANAELGALSESECLSDQNGSMLEAMCA